MINFIDEKGIKHSAIVECKKTKGVNGEKSLSGTIYTNEKILEGIGRGWRLDFENEKYCLTYVYPIDEGNRIVVEFDAVHEFFFDLNKKVVYTELNGSNTAKAYLDLIFNGSGYSYVTEVNIPAFEKEGFGMRNRLDLFKEFISSTGVEFSVNGKVVRILEKVGSNLSTIVKKGFNLNELRIEKDPGSFITYKKGFGAWVDEDDHSKGRLEVEYLSPLASIYGKLEGDPIIDERYKVASNFETRLKNDVESSYGISVDIDMEDLTKAGYEYEQPHEGDYIMAINKDLGFEQKIRIMSYETSYDTNGNIIDHKVSCGSDNIIRKSIKEDDDFRKEIQAGLEGAISTSNKAWISANGKNAVFEGPEEPTPTAIGDIWYQIDGEEKIMRIWNGYEWKPVFNPGEIENKIDQAEKDVAQNIIDIESALSTAEQSRIDAGFATDIAKEAKELGVTASSLASEATTNANTAMTDAQEALTKANASVTDASKALTDATKAFNKSFKSSTIAYATSTNGSTPPSTGWGTSVPTPSPDVYIWTRTTILLNDNTPVVSYSVGKIGAKGDQGSKGDTGGQGIQGIPGVNAPTIKSVVRQFYLSTSKTTQTGGSWLATVPVWSSGKYYWVRVVTTYSNDTTSTSTPVLDNALNDSLVTALEVKTANQNLSTTVTQHATLIEGKANSTTVDALTGRVTTTEGSISTIAGQVELKANSTDVQTLTGRVTTAEGKITTQAGQIALKANTSTVNTLTGRVTTAEGNITTQAGLIALKANQSTVDTLTGRVSTTEAKITATDGKVTTLTTKTDGNTTSIGQLQTSYSGLSSTVATVKQDLDGLEIGQRNLLIGTKKLVDSFSPKVEYKGEMYSEYPYNWTFHFNVDLKEGQKYTIQVPMYNANDTMSKARISVSGTGGNIMNIFADIPPKSYRLWTYTFTAKVTEKNIPIRFLTSSGFPNVAWQYPMMVEGNKVNGWTPAPEDMATVTQFSSLEQTVNGIQTTVGNKADQSQVTQLAGQWSATVAKVDGHTSQLTTLGNQINLRLTKKEVAAEILKDNQVLDTRDTNEPPSWYYTNYPKQTVRELKRNSSIGLSGAGTYSTVTTDVGWSDSSGGNIEQTAKADNGVYQRRGNGASWSAWSKVADTSNILSQINLSTEGVLIQGKNIWLDGNTKINDAVIKTAHISDLAITSAKIADLAVTSAKIVSLDASKISVGTLTGFTINSTTINGGEIRGNSVIYINNGSDNVVLTALHGFSTTRTVAANGVIRSGDWIHAGTNADGTWKAGFGFQGDRLRTNYIDPMYTNSVLNIGNLSATEAKVQVHLDSVFKRSVEVWTALRLADQPSPPGTLGMMSIWCGYGYAGYGIYATAPNGTSKTIAIWT